MHIKTVTTFMAMVCTTALLSACGGGGDATPRYTIGGTVTGLTGSGLTLQNNGGDDLTVDAEGSFTFASSLTDGSSYEVTVRTHPSGPTQMCSVTSGIGTVAGGDVTDVAVNCIAGYTIGGNLSGLPSGTSVTLQSNGTDDLSLTANGTFIFASPLADSSSYEVTVLTQPTGYHCAVNNGIGGYSGGDVNNVGVSCSMYMFSGFVSSGAKNTSEIALGDVDGDGDIDIVQGNGVGTASSIYLNDGSGGFTDSGQALGANDTLAIALGDVDGDGDLDLVEGGWNYNYTFGSIPAARPMLVYLNNGTGTFTDSGQAVGNVITHSIALGDVDGDGDLDLVAGVGNVTVNGAPTGAPNRVYLNDGFGRFTDSGQALGSDYTYSIALGDVDGDGALDLVEGVVGTDAVNMLPIGIPNRVYLNDGFGSFTDSGQAVGNVITHSIALGDVDGDGDLDLVEGNYGFDVVNNVVTGSPDRVYLNDGAGRFSDSGQALGDNFTRTITLGDVDVDGDLDLVVGRTLFEAGTTVIVGGESHFYLNDGTGNFTDSGQAVGGMKSVLDVAMGDVDGDLDLDLVEAGPDHTSVYTNLSY